MAFAVSAAASDADSSRPLYAPLIGAVALAVWYGGIGPAIAMTAVAWTGILALHVEPPGALTAEDREELARWAVALAIAVIVLAMSEVLRVGRRRATSQAEVAEGSLLRIESLQRLTAALAGAASTSDVARVLADRSFDLIGAGGVQVAVLDGEELSVVDPSGLAARARLPESRIPLRWRTPLATAAREGRVVRVDDRATLEASFPDSVVYLPPSVGAALAGVLRSGDEVVGAVGFLFDHDDAVDDEVEALAVTVVGLVEQALERARLYDRERESRQALDRILQVAPSFLADTGSEVIAAICSEARTTFGSDYGVLWRLHDERLEVLCADPPHERLPPGAEWPLEDFPGLADAVSTLGVSFVSDVLAEARGRGLELVRALGVRSSLRSPIFIGGSAELVLVVSWESVVSEPDLYTVAVVRRFADHAGLALEQLERRQIEAQAAIRADQTRRLQEITAELSLAAAPLDVTGTCLRHVLRAVGAEAGFVVLAEPGGTSVEIVTSEGYSERELEGWGGYGLDAEIPYARAIASGEPVWALEEADMAAFAGVVVPESGPVDAGWVTLPLVTGAGVRGAVHVSLRERTTLSETERAWLVDVVSHCAQAFERSRLYEQEQLLRRQAERIQNLTAALSNALTRSDVAEVVVDEVGAAMNADAAVLAVVLEDRQALKALGSRGYGDEEGWLDLPLDDASPATRVVKTRTSAVHDAVSAGVADESGDSPLARFASSLFVPLVAGRRSHGLLVLSFAEPTQVSTEELRFVETLASLAAQAIDRASHFESERSIAETLQRSILPVSLPRVEGLQLAARYLPGSAELTVGGDWFDAMPLPDGRIGLVVGDVVGKGVNAAASMGQLRNALRAFSIERMKPASALTRLNRLADEVLETTFATIVYVVIDPETMICRFASAGHPPPLLVYPDDRVELLEGGRGLPLGAGVDSRYRQETVEVPAGTMLLLYSDGLVERRGRSIDEGLDALCEAGREAPRDAERLLEHVLDRVVGTAERGDDIALLAVRLLPVAPRPLELCVSSRTGSLDLVRDAMRVWLEGTPLGRAESEDVLLAVWEACVNAVEHARDPAEDVVRLTATLDDSRVQVVIEDTGSWVPPSETPGRGLGLRLMRSVMSAVDITQTEEGTRVTVEKTIAADGDGRR